MRDRLIEIVDKSKEEYANDVTDHTETEYIVEGLLNKGAILPPCKVGYTVYQPSYKFTKCSAYDYAPKYVEDSSCVWCCATCDSVKKPYIYQGEVVSIRITKKQVFLAVSFQEKFDSSSFMLGKTVFLTREEAEKALKEKE